MEITVYVTGNEVHYIDVMMKEDYINGHFILSLYDLMTSKFVGKYIDYLGYRIDEVDDCD